MKNKAKIFTLAFLTLLLGLFLIAYLDHALESIETEKRNTELAFESHVAAEYFRKGLERSALLAAAIRAYTDKSEQVPTAFEIQDYLKTHFEVIPFNDSLIISYIDSNLVFKYFATKSQNLSLPLLGHSIDKFRPEEELNELRLLLEKDSIGLMPPINLVEGWSGIPFVFRIEKQGRILGHFSSVLSLKAIVDEVYSGGKSNEFVYRFTTNNEFEFDRYAIYNNSKVYNELSDKEYYKNFNVPVENFVESSIHAYGQTFGVGIAYKQPLAMSFYRKILITSWLVLLGLVLIIIYIQINKTEQLENKNKELENYNQILKDFTFASSHDLKEPLRNIGAFSSLLKKKFYKHLDDDSMKHFDFIINGVKKMHQLLDDLLKYSKLIHGGISTKGEVDMQQVVEDVRENLKSTIKNKNAFLKIGDLPTIVSNQNQMYQLFQNIISNAIKYNDKNTPVIEIGCKRNADKHLFHVKDNGIGIDENFQSKVFEAFQRLYKNEYPGTGVGLTICKKIVEMNNGKIWFESRDGVGTTFYFELPDNQI